MDTDKGRERLTLPQLTLRNLSESYKHHSLYSEVFTAFRWLQILFSQAYLQSLNTI